jgi:hypothetical protein
MPNRRARSPTRNNPFLAWQRLGFRAAETLLASTHVISHRTQRQNTPAQIFEMGSEKVIAAMKSSQALASHGMRLAGRDPLAIWTAWPHMLASGLAPFHARVTRNARSLRRR